MHLVGEGSFTDRRLVRDGKVSLPGKVVTVARHLGSHLGEKASFAHEFPRRRQATMTAFYSVGQSWCESRVSWRLKRCFFIGRVVNTALSGIEAFCPLKAQFQSPTSLVTCLARMVMAGSNKEVLRFWKLVEARVRRLKWAQTLVQDLAHHTQLITAMFGKLPSEPNPRLGPGGEISPEANPWAVRWMADLKELEPYDGRRVIQRMGRDVRPFLLDRELAEDFVAVDVTMLRLRSLAVEVPQWDFREEVGHPVELSEEGVPQWRCCFDEQYEARFEPFKAQTTPVLRHHRQMEVVSRSVITNQCRVCLAVYGDRKAAHRHLLASLRRGSCRDRSRYLGHVHIPLSLRCPVCSSEPGNWSELQQHIAEHLCDIFRNDGRDGLRDAFLGQAQAGGGSARAGPSSGETGCGRRRRRPRRHWARGGRAGDSVRGQRGRTERADRRRVQDVLGSRLGERVRSNGRGGSNLPRIRWRNQEQARSRERRRSRATRSPRTCMCGWRSCAVWRRRGLATEHVAVLKSYWESNVVKSAPVQLAAHVRHCRAKPCKKIDGKEGWCRTVFCLDPVTLPLEGALEAALQLQKGVRKHGPRFKRRARSVEAPNTDAREVERLAHLLNNTVYIWLGSCGVGGTGAFDGVCFPNDEGRTAGATAQIQGQSSGTKSRNGG